MWLMFREIVTHALALVVVGQAQPVAPRDQDRQPPLEYRGDRMQVFSKPNRALLRGSVVIRRGDLLVCCESFEGLADADWGWERFVCTENVVAQRGDETMWADKAEFILETSDLILTGRPLLQRGKSTLEGSRIIVDTERDRARVIHPRGRIHSAERPVKARATTGVRGELPATCPLPASPELPR